MDLLWILSFSSVAWSYQETRHEQWHTKNGDMVGSLPTGRVWLMIKVNNRYESVYIKEICGTHDVRWIYEVWYLLSYLKFYCGIGGAFLINGDDSFDSTYL